MPPLLTPGLLRTMRGRLKAAGIIIHQYHPLSFTGFTHPVVDGCQDLVVEVASGVGVTNRDSFWELHGCEHLSRVPDIRQQGLSTSVRNRIIGTCSIMFRDIAEGQRGVRSEE